MKPVNREGQIRKIKYIIQRLMQAAEHFNKELNKKHGVSIPQLNCLLALHENGPIPLSLIARYIMVNSSTVTGIVDRLEDKGLVKRTRISMDRRVITVSLTDSGRDIVQRAPFPIDEKLVMGFNRLPETERNEIIDALSKLTFILDVEAP
jgi:DNA-binding MarR family transcriptional regulator